MDPMARFLVGCGLGVLAGGGTYAVTQQSPWWWLVALVVALVVWCGRLLADLVEAVTD